MKCHHFFLLCLLRFVVSFCFQLSSAVTHRFCGSIRFVEPLINDFRQIYTRILFCDAKLFDGFIHPHPTNAELRRRHTR
nr:MAG TPA: hypothetical protein [Caudoviricetes sp.]